MNRYLVDFYRHSISLVSVSLILFSSSAHALQAKSFLPDSKVPIKYTLHEDELRYSIPPSELSRLYKYYQHLKLEKGINHAESFLSFQAKAIREEVEASKQSISRSGKREAVFQAPFVFLRAAQIEEMANRKLGTAETSEGPNMTKMKTILSFADVNISGLDANEIKFNPTEFKAEIGPTQSSDALLGIDIQNDFIPQRHARGGGKLGVPHGEQIIRSVRQLMRESFSGKPMFFTRDFHPLEHVSFDSWPEHCVRGTLGASLHAGITSLFSSDLQSALERSCSSVDSLPEDNWIVVDDPAKTQNVTVVAKAYQKDIDSYSGFKGTNLNSMMSEKRVQRTFIVGLATDYCVMHSAIDAAVSGRNPYVILGAVRGVDFAPGDLRRAIAKMKIMGVKFCPSL